VAGVLGVGLIFASCGGSSLPTPTSLKALAQLDKPGSSDSQDKCLTDWWMRHLTADQLDAAGSGQERGRYCQRSGSVRLHGAGQ
jgi:hypothetical protein